MICSSVNRLGFMSIPLRGDGLYSFLEEIAGLRSAAIVVADDILADGDKQSRRTRSAIKICPIAECRWRLTKYLP
jgi:hypothetical protein